MDSVVFGPTAFRHGYSEEDFFGLLGGRYVKIRSQRGVRDVYELLGRNLDGDHLHVVYRTLPEGRLRVFHMNRMTDRQRRAYRRLA